MTGVYSTFMPSLASRYFINGAALRASSLGDSSGIALTRNTACAWATAPKVTRAQVIKALSVREGDRLIMEAPDGDSRHGGRAS